MKIYDELVARGLVAQVTDEDEIKELEDQLQKLTDKFGKDIDKLVEAKSKEIMTV